MSAYSTRIHRDGSISVWNVYEQQWDRRPAASIYRDHRVMETLGEQGRRAVQRAVGYMVEEYAADGHGEQGLFRSHAATLAEARDTVRQRLGVKALRPERKWGGVPGRDIEAYHTMLASEAGSDGCGGYAIRVDDRE